MAIYSLADTVDQMMDAATNGTEVALPTNPFKDFTDNVKAYFKDGVQTITTTIDNIQHNVLYQDFMGRGEDSGISIGERVLTHCANAIGLNVNLEEVKILAEFTEDLFRPYYSSTPMGVIDLTMKGAWVISDLLANGFNAMLEHLQLGGEGGYVLAEGTFEVDGTNYIAGDWSQFCEYMDSIWNSIKSRMSMHQTQPYSEREYHDYWEYVNDASSFTQYWANMKELFPNSNYTGVENATDTVFGYQVVSADTTRNYSDDPYGQFIILAVPLSLTSRYRDYDYASQNIRQSSTATFRIDAYQRAFGFYKSYSWDGWSYHATDMERSYIASIGGNSTLTVSKQLSPYDGLIKYPALGSYQGPASCYGKGEWFVYTSHSPGGEMTDGFSYQTGENQGTVQDTIDSITGDDGFDTDKFLQYLDDNGYNHLSKMLTDEDGNQHLMLPTNLSEIFGLVNDIRELNRNKADVLDNVQADDDNFAYGQEGVVGKLADDGITSPLNMVTVGVNERTYTEGRELYLRQIVPILREGLTPTNKIFKFEYDDNVKNLKVFAGELNSYIIISKCTGNQMQFNPEDIIKLDNFTPHNQKPEFNVTADLRVQGSPKMFPRYYHNTPNNLMLGLITGHTWLNAVNVFYGRYGSELANNNYKMGSKALMVNSNFEQLGNAVGAVKGFAQFRYGMTQSAIGLGQIHGSVAEYVGNPAYGGAGVPGRIVDYQMGTVQSPMLDKGIRNATSGAGGVFDSFGNAIKNELNYRQQKGQLDYANLMATNPTVAPSIEFPYEESNVDLYGNYFTIARYYLSETQRKFLDDFYTLWGYKTGGIDITTDEMDWLHSRKHFNYLSMSNVSLAKKEISVFERQEMEAELGNIRIWHDMLPKDWSQSDGNEIVEVEQ
jgi:hypothetical protein